MKSMTLSEFRDYLESKAPTCFVYSTANQMDIHSTLSIMMKFPTAKVSTNSMRIMLYGNGGYLCMNRVRRILTEDDGDADTKIIRVVCAGQTEGARETTHKIVMGTS